MSDDKDYSEVKRLDKKVINGIGRQEEKAGIALRRSYFILSLRIKLCEFSPYLYDKQNK
ncbi:hypothetical protein BDFB_006652 [Asbolus verrucosus]|uniref:Uncharacterized protein n=1 Tax=Asbolus verrucosus TaxID=1661398 RepID=A0A482VM82_ASBVE|nr:hypothetical protein BDFB_006652 [Asbolus verrucosus]